MIKTFTCIFITSCLFIQQLWAQKNLSEQQLNALYTPNFTASLAGQDTIHYYLIKVDRPEQAFKDLRVHKRIAYNYYVVSSASVIRADAHITQVSAANSLWKATDNLVQQYQNHPQSTAQIELTISNATAAQLSTLQTLGTIINHTPATITLKLNLKNLPAVVQQPFVQFAGLMRIPHEELAISDIDLGANQISSVRDNYPDLTGAGINVAVKEDHYDEDLDLLGRSFNSFTPSDKNSSHATIMATLIGGNGNSYIKGLGAAPAVRFTSSTFNRLLPDSTALFKAYRISVENHSYGTGIENYYGPEAVAYDQQVHDMDTLMHVFSAGNIGTTTPATGVYNGITNRANLSGDFKQAKNALVVGGTGRTNVPEDLSSNGPAYDGRIKPEIMADGEDGTSGAAALTSGTVALLQQAYKKQAGQLPSAALLKAVLINSADDIGTPAVDFKTGYGKLNALEAVRTLTNSHFKTGSVTSRQQASYTITVPAGCSQLKVSLAWNDVPAALNAPFALVNDLDLSVATPGGATLLPWTLSAYPSADSLNRAAMRGRDSLNNTEQVTLTNPPAGTYTIKVNGAKINSGVQSFAVAYQTITANQFEWTYPATGSPLFADDDNYLRWQSSYAATTGQLSVSYDHGSTWTVIASPALADNFAVWHAPDVFTQAMLKITIAGKDYISREFTLSKPRTMNVGYTCADGTLLHWNPQPGNTGYVIYSIKDNLLQKLTTTADTSIIISATQQTSKYFAVSALGNGFEGLKSYTIDATTQGVGCYVKNLLAAVMPDNQVLLTLQVGSVLNLKSIVWQKLTRGNTYTSIGNAAILADSLTYHFVDRNPVKGIQYYRAMLTTASGMVIYSDLANATLLQASQFTLYPNPVGSQLTVLSGDLNNYILQFYDVMGRLKLQKSLNGLQNTLSVNLIPGNYICVISLNGKIVFEGKVIKI